MSRVTDMIDMFRVATSFNQDLSRWDVSSVTYMGDLFEYATAALTATLQRTMYVPSFFEGVYRRMPREERQRAFAGVFAFL